MKGFYLDADGDVVIQNHDVVMVNGLELKLQKIRQVLRTNQGEWRMNPQEGIPMRRILKKNPDMGRIRDCIRKAIFMVDSNLQLTNFFVQAKGRVLTIDFSISDGSREASDQVEV